MTAQRTYYSLQFRDDDGLHRKGDVLKTDAAVLHIGETADCEVRFQNGQSETGYYATILGDAEKGWRLVRRSAMVPVQIAGQGGFGYACRLHDGDVIMLGEGCSSLLFREHHDRHFTEGSTTIIHRNGPQRWLYAALLVTIVALVGLAVSTIYRTRYDEIDYAELDPFRSSVFLLRTDSVQWLSISSGDTTLMAPTLALANQTRVGTAFLTNRGQLITARHCVEYWLADDFDLTTDVASLADNDIHRWAVLTETHNQEAEQSEPYLLRVFCSVYAPDSLTTPVFRFTSTDSNVHINRAHDGVLPLADLETCYYWRTLRPYFQNHQMELGDIMSVDVERKGSIELADGDELTAMRQGRPVAFLGFPMTGDGELLQTPAKGSLRRDARMVTGAPRSLSFEGSINHGFSGGPVFCRSKRGLVAIGVVSRVDSISSGIYKWGVPITEIQQN